jgi:putative component of toxin-antitoxin plasmid stabilization module
MPKKRLEPKLKEILSQAVKSAALRAEFYVLGSGNSPVEKWLSDLSEADRLLMEKAIEKVRLGWPVGMPTCRPLKGGLYEVREKLANNTVEGRIYFGLHRGLMILLVGDHDKDAQDRAIELAHKRLQNFLKYAK